jgi:general secretion pathway protein A
MDYFRILHFKREPFSNSPDPDLFYPSGSHVECLQKLEMAIRLKRGLNIVLGDVGTGKTTLCRRLIQQISNAEKSDGLELHLMLDPSFAVPQEFLCTIAGYFGLPAQDPSLTEWQVKETIKNYLFAKGVEEGKIVVLLIDEGQKLPDFCLEILREFLNYETNDCKLLQIVILAQKEFKEQMKARANFTDRINFFYELGSLSFRETRRMVEYRIRQSSDAEAARPLFTLPGIYALYRATGGFPRSINMLCHHVILALIIQNRTKAGWSLVRACAARRPPEHHSPGALGGVWAMTLAVVAVLVAVLTYNESIITMPATKKVPQQTVDTTKSLPLVVPAAAPSDTKSIRTAPMPNKEPQQEVVAPAINPLPTVSTTEESKPAKKKLPPAVLGELSLKKGATLWHVFDTVYASSNPKLVERFLRMNPKITNLGVVREGTTITVPAIPVPAEGVTNRTWVELAQLKTLKEAYESLATYAGSGHKVALFPYWNERQGSVFAILLKKSFPDREAAQIAMDKIPPAMVKVISIIDTWDSDTVFYHKM